MTTVMDILEDVREQIEAGDSALHEARSRLAFTRSAAEKFYGALHSYRSGSLAAHTMNEPVTDGDGGLVLNRNFYPGLGPEGTNDEEPSDIVKQLCDHLGPLIRLQYPNAVVAKSKRGPKIHFHSPIDDGSDPTVDLVLALTRKAGRGIWIPNLETDTWDASDPEAHIELFNDAPTAFRSTRRKIMRLAKAWNKQYANPGASSFEISVWCYEFVTPGAGIANGLLAVFEGAAHRLEAKQPTPDPSGVSEDLRLLLDSTTMAARLRKAATNLRTALDSSEEDDVEAAMSLLFWKYVEASATSPLAAMAASLRSPEPVAASAIGLPVAATTTAAVLARSYGSSISQ